MSEINKTYRIRTDIGQKTSNDFITIDTNLLQDYETFDILSVKIESSDTYKLHNANYGVVVGRVLANNGFGIPNAKISIFIQSDSEDGDKIRELYPYTSTASKNSEGIRYNLLPDEKVNDCHAVVGTFPNKRYALDNDVILEVFDKYYKYTTRTNNAGDYLIMGVPVGTHTLHMDLDLSDCGILSQRPRDFVYKGYTIEQFENPNMFKDGNAYSNLSQIFTQDRVVNVQPFWGNASLGEKIGITRADIDVAFKFEPTCVFIGSVVSDNSSQGITKKCMATENMGYMEELTTGEGTIEMIRKTPNGSIEEFQIKGTQLINGDGVWCYQIPMNLDYMMTDEYGNMVPTDDPEKGIPTRTQVRFRMSMQDNEENVDNFFRAKVLVPHNPQILENGKYEEYDYEFGSMTRDDSFRDLFWNNVYSVKSYIPRFQKRKITGWKDKKFTGFKGCNFYGDNNPIPYNNIRIKLPFMFTIICAIVKIFIAVVAFINTCISVLGNVCADLGDTWFFGYPLKKLYKYALKLTMIVLREGLCPDLENWYFSPMFKNNLWVPEKDPPRDWARYDLLTQTFNKIYEEEYLDDVTSIDTKNNEESEGEEPICLTIYTDYLISCVEMNLAMEYKVINFDFYNDWINGVLYFPRFMRYLRPKRTFLGITFARAKIKGCMDDTKIFSKTRRYTQQCSVGFKGANSNNADTFTNVDSSFLGTTSSKKLKAINNFHKKRGFTQKTIFGRNGGVCHETTTTKGHNIYYMKPCEWIRDSIPANKKVNLFATDIILLGSLNDCDIYGVPQAFKYLSSTSYVLPTNLALTNMDTNGNLYATVKGTICAGASTLSYNDVLNATSGITVVPPSSGLSGEILYYSGAQDSNYDIMYDGLELSDIIALTEAAGIAWNYTGPGQGEEDDSRLYQPGGHFLGMSCTNSQTNIKSCINLSRICEMGVNMSQRKEDIFEISSKGVIEYKYTTPSGFISGDDIVGGDFRTMFATLNKRRLIATKTDPHTGYKIYDFNYVNPINFNGGFKNIVDDNRHLYNKKIDVPIEKDDVFKQIGIDTNVKNRPDHDVFEKQNTQTRTIEDTSIDYYAFRMGLNHKELKKNNQLHLRRFLLSDGSYQYLPQFENSYYFYFGLKTGATAIDEFNKQFFSSCENGMLLGNEPIININIMGDINICKANADLVITTTNLETPYQFIEIRSDVSDGVLRVDSKNDTQDWLTSYSFTLPDMPFGEYTVTIRDANDVEHTKSSKIGKDVVEYNAELFDFNTTLKTGNLGTELHKGGYIEVSNVNINRLEENYDLTLTVYKDIEATDYDTFISSAHTTNNNGDVIKLSVNEAGKYNLFIEYVCENNKNKIFMQSFSINDGTSIGLSIGTAGIISKSLSVETHGAHTGWWKSMGGVTYWLERVCLFNETTNENIGRETMSSRVFATGGSTKCVWGPAQNKEGLLKNPDINVYCSEDFSAIPTGYLVDDETIYFPTYAYHRDDLPNNPEIAPNYSVLAYKNNLVMGNYYAYLDNGGGTKPPQIKYVDKKYFVKNNGYIFKPLPDGDLQFHVCNKDGVVTYEGDFENGVFYPSVSFPILDRPFYAKTNYFVWQNRYIGVEVDNVSGEEKTAIIDAEMAGKVEMKLYNGVTYNGKFAENSFIDNINIGDITFTDDTIGASSSNDRVTNIKGFRGGSIDKSESGITSFGYDIIEGYPEDTPAALQMVNSLSNFISRDFPDYAMYDVYGGIHGPFFTDKSDAVVDWFLCRQPNGVGDDNKIIMDTGPLYDEYKERRFHFGCTYTDKAYNNVEGASLIASVKDPRIGKTVFTFPIKDEDGVTITKKIKFKNKWANSLYEYFDRINENIPEIRPLRRYAIYSGSTTDWSKIIDNHRRNFESNKNADNCILYGVAVIAKEKRDDHFYGDDDMAIYKIYPNLVKILEAKEFEYTEIILSPTEIEASYNESDYRLTVTEEGATIPWTAETNSDWIEVIPSTYVGTTEVIIRVKENGMESDREGVVRFSSNSTDETDYTELLVRQTMAIANSESISIINSSPLSDRVPLDDDAYRNYENSQSLSWFEIKDENINTVTLYPPVIRVNYSFKNEVDMTYAEDIEKSTNFYIVVTLYDTFGNVIDDIAFNAKDYNGVNTPSNNFMTFNPKNFQDGRFELSMKCEISCDASNEIKYGYHLDYSLDPGESFNIVKK